MNELRVVLASKDSLKLPLVGSEANDLCGANEGIKITGHGQWRGFLFSSLVLVLLYLLVLTFSIYFSSSLNFLFNQRYKNNQMLIVSLQSSTSVIGGLESTVIVNILR